MDKILKPVRFDVDPESTTAAKEWKYLFRTFENFIEESKVTEDGKKLKNINNQSRSLVTGDKWKTQSHKAKYSPNPLTDGYFPLPKSLKDESIKQYVQVPAEDAKLSIPGTLWCHPNDARVGLIFCNNGSIVGLQHSILDQDVKNVQGYNYTQHLDTYIRTNIFNTPAYSFRVYYTNPEKLTSAGRNVSNDTFEDIYVQLKGQLVKVPKDDPKVNFSEGFCRQACFPQMGQHYFYEMNNNFTDCTKHIPFFAIYHNGGLVGYGLATYGQGSQLEGGRGWFESIPSVAVKAIMPNRPSCVDKLVDDNGMYSLHTYFVQHPYFITCPLLG